MLPVFNSLLRLCPGTWMWLSGRKLTLNVWSLCFNSWHRKKCLELCPDYIVLDAITLLASNEKKLYSNNACCNMHLYINIIITSHLIIHIYISPSISYNYIIYTVISICIYIRYFRSIDIKLTINNTLY